MALCVFIILALLLWEHLYVEMCKERERNTAQFSLLPAFFGNSASSVCHKGILLYILSVLSVVSAHCISHHLSC